MIDVLVAHDALGVEDQQGGPGFDGVEARPSTPPAHHERQLMRARATAGEWFAVGVAVDAEETKGRPWYRWTSDRSWA